MDHGFLSMILTSMATNSAVCDLFLRKVGTLHWSLLVFFILYCEKKDTLKMSCLPKPVLRGHLKRKGLQAVVGALTFATINSCLFHFFYRLPKEKRTEEFMKNYDAKAHCRDLIEWGYFQSVRPEDLRSKD